MKKSSIQKELINNYSNLDLEILPKYIKKNGFEYFLIQRDKQKCIYSQNKNRLIGYEVFKTKIYPYRARMAQFKKTNNPLFDELKYKEYKESFPNDEEFGKRAWTYKNLDEAIKKYEGL